MTDDEGTVTRMHAPSAERNRDAILAVLSGALPDRGTVLEIASGTGQHAAHFARALPLLSWQPTEPRTECHESIAAWTAGLENVRPPVALDARDVPWPVETADAIVCINMIHISPWASCLALLEGAGRVLRSGAPLFLYGPYSVHGEHVAESNVAFDADLRRRDAAWGVRDVDDVEAAAAEHGLSLADRVPTPRNNMSLVFRRASSMPGSAAPSTT